jgi:hypothetical protein
MSNSAQRDSEITANFPKKGGEIKSNPSTKRVLSIVGGTILAVAVAFGGGAVLSEFPSTVTPPPSDQASQVNTQVPNPATTSVVNNTTAPTPVANATTAPASSTNTGAATTPNTNTAATTPSTNTDAAAAPTTNTDAVPPSRAGSGNAPPPRPGTGTGATSGAANPNNVNQQRDRGGLLVGVPPIPRGR